MAPLRNFTCNFNPLRNAENLIFKQMILEDACRKQKLNPDDFDICHYNKRLDLTVPVRFANLPNLTQLELKPVLNARQNNLVSIALQLESGERIMKEFSPLVSVLDVLEQCLGSERLRNYKEEGDLVCIYMRQKLVDQEIKNTTLKSLGLTKGSAIIRFSVKRLEAQPEQTAEGKTADVSVHSPTTELQPEPIPMQTNVSREEEEPEQMECDLHPENNKGMVTSEKESQISPVPLAVSNKQMEVPSENLSSEKVENQQINVQSENLSSERVENSKPQREKLLPFSGKGISLRGDMTVHSKTSIESAEEDRTQGAAECDTESNEEIGAVHYVGERHAVIYSLDDITEVKKADLPDEFFEITVDDIKYLYEQYKKARLELENRPLLTKELRNQQILKTLGRYKQTVIRVIFPERLVLQAVFDSSETVKDVQDFIRRYLEDESSEFHLYTSPPKEKKDPTKSLIESMLIPAAVLYFGCQKKLPFYLSRSLKDKISDPRAAAVAAYESRQQAMSSDPEDMTEENEDALHNDLPSFKAPGPSSTEPVTKPQSSEKVPKWLKLSKK